jgi:hypothetical protein
MMRRTTSSTITRNATPAPIYMKILSLSLPSLLDVLGFIVLVFVVVGTVVTLLTIASMIK